LRAAIYLRDGLPVPGTRFRNPELAATYQRLVQEAEAAGLGREAQIEGALDDYSVFVTEAIQHFCRPEIMDSSRMPPQACPLARTAPPSTPSTRRL
jgi:gamma-glutamyltranspeptidase / glutathione hydrolase